MKRFLAVYTGSPEAMARWQALPEGEREQRQARGVAAWMAWGTEHASAIVEMGGPLGRTKRASADGIADVRNHMTGFTVVQAESHEAAAKLFAKHPHFTILPGDGVEVMEVLPIPAR